MTCIPCRTRKKKWQGNSMLWGVSTVVLLLRLGFRLMRIDLIARRISINCRYDKPLTTIGEFVPICILWHDPLRILLGGYFSSELMGLSKWTDNIDIHLTTATLATLTSRGRNIRSAYLPYIETSKEWLPVVPSSELDDCAERILFSNLSKPSQVLELSRKIVTKQDKSRVLPGS